MAAEPLEEARDAVETAIDAVDQSGAHPQASLLNRVSDRVAPIETIDDLRVEITAIIALRTQVVDTGLTGVAQALDALVNLVPPDERQTPAEMLASLARQFDAAMAPLPAFLENQPRLTAVLRTGARKLFEGDAPDRWDEGVVQALGMLERMIAELPTVDRAWVGTVHGIIKRAQRFRRA